MPSIRPPAEIVALIAVIGEDATLRLVETHGGIRTYVPRTVSAKSALAQSIGVEAARGLSREFGGMKIHPPMVKRWRALVLRQRDGLSYSEIARRLSVDDTTVYKWLNAGGLIGRLKLPGLSVEQK